MPELMTKQDAIKYLLYMKHDVQAKSPMDIAIDTAIEALKQPTIEPEALVIKPDAVRILTDEEKADFEEWLTHNAAIELEVPTMDEPKLRNCPFCGRKPKVTDLGQVKILACEFSGCAVHPRICYTWKPEKEKEAFNAWNRRADNG